MLLDVKLRIIQAALQIPGESDCSIAFVNGNRDWIAKMYKPLKLLPSEW